jgi:heme exporter protein A
VNLGIRRQTIKGFGIAEQTGGRAKADGGFMRLVAAGLRAVRGGREVFVNQSFTVRSGELLAVTGPNGSGKSTMLRLVAGLVRPAAGTVTLDPAGEDEVGGAAHYLGHLDALKPALTVEENLVFWKNVWGGDGLPPDAALERVGLVHLADLPAGILSAGQRRRVAIARLLLSRRPVWLLDEPTTALDARAETTLGGIIEEHLAGGGMAVVATHRALAVAPAATLALGQAA